MTVGQHPNRLDPRVFQTARRDSGNHEYWAPSRPNRHTELNRAYGHLTYNLVDTIFVGRGVGPTAIGALTLVLPFQFFVMAFGNLIGIGAGSIVSRSLGAKNRTQAQRATGTAIGASIILGIVAAVVGTLFLDELVRLLGASAELENEARMYLRIILLGEPLILLNLATNNIIRAEGQARVAMSTMVIGMLVNIGLDPLFIFAFGLGVKGPPGPLSLDAE